MAVVHIGPVGPVRSEQISGGDISLRKWQQCWTDLKIETLGYKYTIITLFVSES
jgi:hypothetical protein